MTARRAKSFLVLVLVGLVAPALADELRQLPPQLELDAIQASIQAMQRNGVLTRLIRERTKNGVMDNSRLPVRHEVACDSQSTCEEVARWGADSGFEPSAVWMRHGHGGFPEYRISLSRDVTLAGPAIREQALRIYRRVEAIDGAHYKSWMLDPGQERARHAR